MGDEYEVVMNFGSGSDGGAPLEEASFMIVESDRIIGVCLVQLFNGVPEILISLYPAFGSPKGSSKGSFELVASRS